MIKVMGNLDTIVTKHPQSPFPVEMNLDDILLPHFLFAGGDTLSTQELFVVVIPITKRFIRGGENLFISPLDLKGGKVPPAFRGRTLGRSYGQGTLHV
jgi:hypothetical protein